MPWQTRTPVQLREEFMQLCATETLSLSELCRRFGISRKTGYKWRARYAQAGPAGLVDHSRRPQRSPGQTAPAVEAAVVALRAAHPRWGARKLRRLLQGVGVAPVPASSTLTRILHRQGLIAPAAPEASPRWRRFEHPVPNSLWQMDFKGRVRTLAGPGHPLTILDDHSRFNLCLTLLPNQQTPGVQAALTTTFRRYGLPDCLLVDNGSPWGSDAEHPWTPLTVWIVRVGARVSHSAPYHPQTLGKDERFHRTLAAEVLATRQWRDRAHCQAAVDRWRVVYNTERPHEALGLAVPASRYTPSLRPFPDPLPPIDYPAGLLVRKVQQGGRCSVHGWVFQVPKAFVGYPVGLRPRAEDGAYDVLFCHQRILALDLRSVAKV
jgi:transposase InsO family protein